MVGCVLGSNATTVADRSAVIVGSILATIYGIAGLSAFFFIAIPRLMAAPATDVVGAAAPIALARQRIAGVRWAPAYGVRTQPGEYVPRHIARIQRMKRLYAAPNRRFPPLNQVCESDTYFDYSTYSIVYVLFL